MLFHFCFVAAFALAAISLMKLRVFRQVQGIATKISGWLFDAELLPPTGLLSCRDCQIASHHLFCLLAGCSTGLSFTETSTKCITATTLRRRSARWRCIRWNQRSFRHELAMRSLIFLLSIYASWLQNKKRY